MFLIQYAAYAMIELWANYYYNIIRKPNLEATNWINGKFIEINEQLHGTKVEDKGTWQSI